MTDKMPVLHHYTSAQGLLGILQSNSVWATQIHFLNDSMEFGAAINHACGFLIQRSKEDAASEIICNALIRDLGRISNMYYYVACFSESRDSLSQWRGYCPQGSGYCISLQGEKLKETAKAQGFVLRKCVYDVDEQHRIVKEWVDNTVESLIRECPDGQIDEFLRNNIRSWSLELAKIAPIIKHQAFKDEKEWRLTGLVKADDDRIQFRVGKSTLVPYVSIELPGQQEGAISSIMAGPTPHPVLANSALSLLTRKYGIREIESTKVPYRDW